MDNQRQHGKYYTKDETAKITAEYVKQYCNPSFILEPYAGIGTLVKYFKNIKGVVNDIDPEVIPDLKLLEPNYTVFNDDLVEERVFAVDIIKKWKLPIDDHFVIYTNPPFGTEATNNLASKKEEGEIRRNNMDHRIPYDVMNYGGGDLILPTLGMCIEILKLLKKGYLCFFSPFACLCNRPKYQLLLNELLLNFEFVYGEIFGGDMFNDVNKKMAISFSIWKLHPNRQSLLTECIYKWSSDILQFKSIPLIKESWKYMTKPIRDTLIAPACDRFNTASARFIHWWENSNFGSSIHPDNVIKEINGILPSELYYTFWSTVVGYGSIAEFSVPFNGCNVHLPDFKDPKVNIIIAYAIVFNLIREKNNNYCKGHVDVKDGSIIFGNYSKHINSFLIKYKALPILDVDIACIIRLIESNEIPKKAQIDIRNRIKVLLDEIGYWNSLPISN